MREGGDQTKLTRAGVFTILALLFASTAWTADQLALYVGEWPPASGAAVEGVFVRNHLVSIPFLFLDGSKFETVEMVRIGNSQHAYMTGPVVGSINASGGATPYYGVEVRTKDSWGNTSLINRVAYRRTREQRMSRFGIFCLEQAFPNLHLRASYEPIQRLGPWDHRFALKAAVPFRTAWIGLEVRKSIHGGRTSANTEVVLPLK